MESKKKEFIDGINYIERDDKLFAFLCGQMARFLIGKKKGKEEIKVIVILMLLQTGKQVNF